MLASVAEQASLSLIWSETPEDTDSRDEAHVYVHESRRSKAVLLLWFIFIAIVCPLPVCLRLCKCCFRIAWWPAVGKVLSSWLFTCAAYYFIPS